MLSPLHLVSPRRHPRLETRTDLASLGLTLLAGSVVSAAVAAVALYREITLISVGDPREDLWMTLRVAAVREDAQPFLTASLLMGWVGVVVGGIGATRLWTRRARRNRGPVLSFSGLSVVAVALLTAFLIVWRFQHFTPACVSEGMCTNEEYAAIASISYDLLSEARLAIVIYVVAGSAGLLTAWFGLDRMRRERERPREGGLPRRFANPTSRRLWP